MSNKFVDVGDEWKFTFVPLDYESSTDSSRAASSDQRSGSPRFELPDNPTPEQFEQAEPIILQAILEEYYTDGMEPINKRDYRRIAPGRYQGEFRDEGRRFSFNVDVDAEVVSYRPINPEEID